MNRFLTIALFVSLLSACSSPSNKRFFITGVAYNGNLKLLGGGGTGLEGGDNLCNQVAAGAETSGTWKAWLSDDQNDALDRIQDVGPWYSLSGKRLFNNKSNLVSVPLVELDVSVLGSTSSAGTVWTGTQTGGVRTMASNCVGWTSDSDVGEVGEGGTISQWTDNGAQPCGSPAGLYCIEQ